MHPILNFQPTALFPQNKDADADPRCKVISQVMKARFEEAKKFCHPTQESLIRQALDRHHFLTDPKRFHVPQFDGEVMALVEGGVPLPIARQYCWFRLDDEEKSRWKFGPNSNP